MKKKRNVQCELLPEKDSPRGKKQETQQDECPVECIPDYVFESLARCALPTIQAYYESAEGRKAYEEWKAKRQKTGD